ncbi:hypothetical protein [Streptomyces sp. NPDC053813]|uniref:hypothetical protein n=1 Tax=Streptomyces sp. NPDC053813 TaxID=3365717 RepID=UPI0037D49ADF
MAAYKYALAAANYPQVDAWEIWNEADAPGSNAFSSGNESADQYTAMMKAAAIGFHDSPGKPLISDAGTAGQRKPYTDLMARNDLFSYADIHAFHLYATDDGSEVPNAWGGIPPHLDLVNTYGRATTKRWITEGGVKFQVPTPQADDLETTARPGPRLRGRDPHHTQPGRGQTVRLLAAAAERGQHLLRPAHP